MSEKYSAKSEWGTIYKQTAMTYPAEYVIRILKGKYPKLEFNQNDFQGRKFIDLSCGDGRHLILAKTLGFKVYGTEISEEIIEQIKVNLAQSIAADAELKVGFSHSLPFEDHYFDYALSWNACYYMGQYQDFQDYVNEFGRIIKPGGVLILSIPKLSCFIFDRSQEERQGYRVIQGDYFNTRNGEVMRAFADESEIEAAFSEQFTDFVFGSVHDDCFGLNYHWHLVVCKKR